MIISEASLRIAATSSGAAFCSPASSSRVPESALIGLPQRAAEANAVCCANCLREVSAIFDSSNIEPRVLPVSARCKVRTVVISLGSSESAATSRSASVWHRTYARPVHRNQTLAPFPSRGLPTVCELFQGAPRRGYYADADQRVAARSSSRTPIFHD